MRAECEYVCQGAARGGTCVPCVIARGAVDPDAEQHSSPPCRCAVRCGLCESRVRCESEWSLVLVPRVAVTIKRKKAKAVTRPCYTVQCSNVTFGV